VNAVLVQALQRVLAKGPSLHFAAVFGSRARGTHRPDSDIDLAWLPRDRSLLLTHELQLQGDLAMATGMDIDLVRVDEASTVLRHEIARDGQLVFGERAAFVRFQAEAVVEFLDYEPVFREANERFCRRLALRGLH
jgi:predicted nucleotidyltransferase